MPKCLAWVAPLSLEVSLGAGKSLTSSDTLSLVGSFSLLVVLAWPASLEVSEVIGGVSVEVGWLDSGALGMFTQELGGGVMRMARG